MSLELLPRAMCKRRHRHVRGARKMAPGEHPLGKPWNTNITIDGVTYNLGYSFTKEEAQDKFHAAYTYVYGFEPWKKKNKAVKTEQDTSSPSSP